MESINISIIQSYEKILRAFNRQDAREVARNYFNEAKLSFLSSDLVQGTEEIEAHWKILMGRGIKKLKFKTIATEASGATALEVGKYEFFLENSQIVDIGEYIAIWRKKDNEWKLCFHQLNSKSREIFNNNSCIRLNKWEPNYYYVHILISRVSNMTGVFI